MIYYIYLFYYSINQIYDCKIIIITMVIESYVDETSK